MKDSEKEKRIKKLISKLQKLYIERDKIGWATPLDYGWGTQRLGHAQRKLDIIGQDSFKIRMELDDLMNGEFRETYEYVDGKFVKVK